MDEFSFGDIPVDGAALCALEHDIHHRFGQVKLLALALAHSSWANEQGRPGQNNERLEFLGDAVLELSITQEAYLRYPSANEGELTKLRSRLVKAPTLAGVARAAGIDRHVLLGRGEESQGGRERESLLADALEAVLGAVFLDAGFEVARGVVLELFKPLWPEALVTPAGKDHKSRLQELTQQLFRDRPVYAQVDQHGPDHEKLFEVEARLPNGQVFRATSTSVKKAEQSAAARAMAALKGQAQQES